MTKKLDPALLEILTKYGERPEDALWDCHGTWVAYHKAIERIAAKAGIVFERPDITETDASQKIAVIVVGGKMGDRYEWSFGEAAPYNNKNAYPYAMAEKRAKDRVVLKLVGLHGLVYSEEESDDFKPAKAPPPAAAPVQRETSFPLRKGWEYQEGDPQAKSSAQLKREGISERFKEELYVVTSLRELVAFEDDWAATARREGVPTAWKHAMCDLIEGHEKTLLDNADAAELASVPLGKALKQSVLLAGE